MDRRNKKKEFKFHTEHIRRAQWKDFYKNKDIEETDQKTHIPILIKN